MANLNPNQSLVKYDNAILVSTTKDKKGKKGKKGGKEQVSKFGKPIATHKEPSAPALEPQGGKNTCVLKYLTRAALRATVF